MPAPGVREQASGAPMTTPPLEEVWDACVASQRERSLRTTHHYWYHLGESQAIRQLLGHTSLPSFVGDQGGKAPYTPEDF